MSKIKVLVIGGGGREHALAWKLAQSPRVAEVLIAPGNAGTAHERGVRNVAVAAEDITGLLQLVRDEQVAFTVVGPEGPLAARRRGGRGRVRLISLCPRWPVLLQWNAYDLE